MFSLSTLYCTTVDWSLTTQIKQWERNVVFGWAGVCGEGWKTPAWEASSPHDQRCLLEQGRIYQNSIYGRIFPSNLTCWDITPKKWCKKKKKEFACPNLKRVVAWDGQRRINLGCRYPHASPFWLVEGNCHDSRRRGGIRATLSSLELFNPFLIYGNNTFNFNRI